tara:strand:- start:2544 stop:3971 length:1428 start_codon:yes stop_codon:yes gene_type:complete
MITINIFKKPKILVVGDAMLDKYWLGATSRISPEAPVPVVNVDIEEYRIGGAGNVAVNASALGADAEILSLVGDDSNAELLESMLSESGVFSMMQRVPDGRTITKLRVLSHNQQLIRLDFEPIITSASTNYIIDKFHQNLHRFDVVILSDYAKGTLAAKTENILSSAKEAGKIIIVDPKGNHFEKYRGATIITPNISEFEAVAGKCSSLEEIFQRGKDLLIELELNALLITRGELGMVLIEKNHPPVSIPANSREVFDVTGAGDTVVATLGAALGSGSKLIDAVHLANMAAGIVVGKLGTASISLDELNEALDPRHSSCNKTTCKTEELLEKVKAARMKGERIVMTNGCFDILHPGHIQYLKQASQLGDRLIIAVNSDDSVSRLKGPNRPINSLEARLEMLCAYDFVDWVISFDEETPERLYEKILPDILVKGGDYCENDIAGARQVRSAGGEIKILNFLPGHSTSMIIDKIKGN